MTADVETTAVGEDPRAGVIADAWNKLWELVGEDEVRADEMASVIEALDRHDTDQGVVRVNLLKQRAIEAERDRLRGALHAVLQSFESGDTYIEGPNGTECLQSIPIPRSMVEGWCLIAEGGR